MPGGISRDFVLFAAGEARLRRVWQKFACTTLLVALVVAIAQPAEAGRRKKSKVDRYASIVIDMTDGTVLRERKADLRRYPASLTKMMTLYMVFDALDNGKLRRYQRLPVSRHAAAQEPSSLRLQPGDTIKVEDAVLALVTKSANDVAVVLAEAIGGTERNFANMMTLRARQLGMRNTVFKNASGLFHPQQVSTARDMATLSMAVIENHPRYYHYFSTEKFTFAGKTYKNHNKLMRVYNGMDGIKTGYVHKSGFNLAASVERDGRRLIGIVFGGRTANSRNAHMAALLDRAFAKAARGEGQRIASAATVLPQRKPRFDAMGLVMRAADGDSSYAVEEGDAPVADTPRPRVIGLDGRGGVAERFRHDGQKVASAAAMGQGWMIQVGAFVSVSAGQRALMNAQNRLPQIVIAGKQPVLVPLATDRGPVYRARLGGFDKVGAENACRILRGNCLILSAQ